MSNESIKSTYIYFTVSFFFSLVFNATVRFYGLEGVEFSFCNRSRPIIVDWVLYFYGIVDGTENCESECEVNAKFVNNGKV